MKIPCENCITLAICKAKVKGYSHPFELLPQSILDKCSLIKNYCQINEEGKRTSDDSLIRIMSSVRAMKFLKDSWNENTM